MYQPTVALILSFFPSLGIPFTSMNTTAKVITQLHYSRNSRIVVLEDSQEVAGSDLDDIEKQVPKDGYWSRHSRTQESKKFENKKMNHKS